MCRIGVFIRAVKKAEKAESLNKLVQAWNDKNMTKKDLDNILNREKAKRISQMAPQDQFKEIKKGWDGLKSAISRGFKK